VIKKEDKKILKYKDLIKEIQRMWNVKAKVKPVIIGATGTISKSFRKYLSSNQESTISRNYRKHLYWAQHTLREVLM
jgi:stalled ribosome rescue protein Dom34